MHVPYLLFYFGGVTFDGDSGRVYIHVLDPEGGKDHVQHGYNEDDDYDDVVENVGSTLLFWLIYVHHPDYHEENAHHHLKGQNGKVTLHIH